MGVWGNFGKRKAEGEGRLVIGDWGGKGSTFLILNFGFRIGEGIPHVPHSRDALTRAKDAKPRRRSGDSEG